MASGSKRLDRLLMDLGLCQSRTMAQRCLSQGTVVFLGPSSVAIKLKSSFAVPEIYWDPQFWQITPSELTQFVSRGGLKLQGALKDFSLSCSGKTILDMGQSTGGFTDCLLQYGASRVFGIDVGRNQLAPRLREDPRVFFAEGVNGKEPLADHLFHSFFRGEPVGFDMIVGDLSFISVSKVLPQLVPLLVKGGFLLHLIKPQFEVGAPYVGKGGIVKDEKKVKEVLSSLGQQFKTLGLKVVGTHPSCVRGDDGNQEYFLGGLNEGV